MYTIRFLLMIITYLTVAENMFAQSGATGTTGGDMTNLGYINYTAAFGKDQQIASGGNVTIGANGNMDIYGALQIDNGGTLELLTGAVLNLYGNMTVNGTLAISTGATINYYGKLWTNGSTAQVTNNGVLTGTPGNAVNFITPQLTVPASWTTATSALSSYSGATQAQDLDGNDIPMNIVMHVQNTSNINLIKSNTYLSGQLSFDIANGYVVTNTNEFVFTNIGTYLGASTDRYIQTNSTTGRVRKIGLANGSSFLFPVGFSIPSSYTPANIQVTAGGADNYHVNVNDFATSPTNESIVNPNVGRTWLVYADLNGLPGVTNSVTLNFVHYLALESIGYNHFNSAVFQTTDVGNWRSKPYDCGPEVTSPYGLPSTYYSQKIESVELPNCPTCSTPLNGSYFTKSNCAPIILAVQLGEFNASVNNCEANLTWKTFSETNSIAFIVERSYNNVEWQAIGTVAVKGNLNGSSYLFKDNNATGGKIFYRLKIADADGSYAYSSIKDVNKTCGNFTVQVYPNPAHTLLNINVPLIYKKAVVNLYGNTGRLVATLVTQGSNTCKINMSMLPAGIYLLQVFNGNQVIKIEKVVKY